MHFFFQIFCRHYLTMEKKKGLCFRWYLVGTSQCCGRAAELSITLYDQLVFDQCLQMLRFRWRQEKTAASKDVLLAPECTDYVICAYHSLACFSSQLAIAPIRTTNPPSMSWIRSASIRRNPLDSSGRSTRTARKRQSCPPVLKC